MEGDMRRIITIAIIITTAAFTTAWGVSTAPGNSRGMEIRAGGGDAMPVRSVTVW
jgi:hypothetical protein